jgi:hypothetical protein
VKRFIGCGGSADVYECNLEEKNIQMAVKIFHIVDSPSVIDRDISTGFDKRLDSEYTLSYEETFVLLNRRCIAMKLFKTSLDKIIYQEPKQLMSDDV